MCKGCQNEFRNMDHHLKKSFTCQNYYNIDEVINISPSTKHEPRIGCTEDSQDKMTANLQTKGEKTDQEMGITKKLDESFLSCLDSNNWLNDVVINEYLKLANELDTNVFIFTSFFHTAFREGGFKRVKSYYRKQELLQYKELYIPVHKENHWFLITFNGSELVAYDPFNFPQCSTTARQHCLDNNKSCTSRFWVS